MNQEGKSQLITQIAEEMGLHIINLQLAGEPLMEVNERGLITSDLGPGIGRDFTIHTRPNDYPIWLSIGNFSLYVKHTDEGVIVEGFAKGHESVDCTAHMQLWDADIPE